MDASERSEWISRAARYVRLCADSIETITIETADHDTVTFRKGHNNESE